MKLVLISCLVLTAFAFSACSPSSKQPDLIPRDVLFGNPENTQPQISPDGNFLAYLAPLDGVMNIWVRTLGKKNDRAITADKHRGIRGYGWAWDDEHIIYVQDKDGDENWHINAVVFRNPDAEPRDLTPFDGVQARFVKASKRIPGKMLIQMNKDNPQAHDVYMLDIKSGELTFENKNPGNVLGWTANDDLVVLASTAMNADGGSTILLRKNADADWKPFITHGPDESAGLAAFGGDGMYAYVEHNLKSDKACLFRVNLETFEEELVFEPEKADTGGVFTDPDTHKPLAVSTNYLRKKWHILDDSIRGDFDAIAAIREGDFSVISRDRENSTWLLAFTTDNGPVYYYSYDRGTREAAFLFSNRPELESLELADMKPVVIPARDGMELVCYLTLPKGLDHANLPLVLLVHGGPWARDAWGYDPMHQWLSNRGYAVMAVNFRGSTGFGKEYLNAGNREWAAKMHDDLIDAVNWAVEKGYTDADKVAIMGGSYGGYATLVGAAFTPDVFCCGVDIVGPSNIMTLIESIPPYWAPMLNMFKHRMGDWEKEPEYIKSISPLFKADEIKIPLLIGQGKNDPRVKVREALQIVEALEKKGRDVMYIEFPDEGHGFARPENNKAFNAAVESFLARHLNGRCQPASVEEQELLDKVTKS